MRIVYCFGVWFCPKHRSTFIFFSTGLAFVFDCCWKSLSNFIRRLRFVIMLLFFWLNVFLEKPCMWTPIAGFSKSTTWLMFWWTCIDVWWPAELVALKFIGVITFGLEPAYWFDCFSWERQSMTFCMISAWSKKVKSMSSSTPVLLSFSNCLRVNWLRVVACHLLGK